MSRGYHIELVPVGQTCATGTHFHVTPTDTVLMIRTKLPIN